MLNQHSLRVAAMTFPINGTFWILDHLSNKIFCIITDVKPSNILVNSFGEIKICDFGVSRQLTESTGANQHPVYTFVGTRSYMAVYAMLWYSFFRPNPFCFISAWTFRRRPLHRKIWCVESRSVTGRARNWSVSNPNAKSTTTRRDIRSCMQLNTASYDPVSSPGLSDQVPALSYFDQLTYISTESPPSVPLGVFTPEFKDFVDSCLKKEPNDRPDLNGLMVSAIHIGLLCIAN